MNQNLMGLDWNDMVLAVCHPATCYLNRSGTAYVSEPEQQNSPRYLPKVSRSSATPGIGLTPDSDIII